MSLFLYSCKLNNLIISFNELLSIIFFIYLFWHIVFLKKDKNNFCLKFIPNTSIKAKSGITVHKTSSFAIIFILFFSLSLLVTIELLSKSLSSLFDEYFNIPINSSVPYISFSFPSKSHKQIVPFLIQKRPFKSVII